MQSWTSIGPGEDVSINYASQLIVTNSDGGLGQYTIGQEWPRSEKDKDVEVVRARSYILAVCSTRRHVVASDKVAVVNRGETRLQIGWEGRTS